MSLRYRFVLMALLVFLSPAAQPTQLRAEDRTFDGTNNNPTHAEWGAAGANFARQAAVGYVDGISIPHVAGRPNPRDRRNMSRHEYGAQRISGSQPC